MCAGSSQCVESLLSHGADPDHQVSHLGSPLYVSCLHRQISCSKVLLHRGVFIAHKNTHRFCFFFLPVRLVSSSMDVQSMWWIKNSFVLIGRVRSRLSSPIIFKKQKDRCIDGVTPHRFFFFLLGLLLLCCC